MKTYITGLLAFIILFPAITSAEVVKRTERTLSITTDDVVNGNFYGAGNAVSISGEINGDAHIAGGNVTVPGKITEDLFVLGGTVAVTGLVEDDVRIIAGEVTISGTTTGNMTIAAGRVKILSSATIGGDVMIYAGEVVIEGSIGGSVYGNIAELRIDGPVAKNIEVTTESLTLGKRADVSGSIVYVSSSDLTRANESRIEGQIVRNDPVLPDTRSYVRGVIIFTFVLLFTTLVMWLLARRRLESLAHQVVKDPYITMYGVMVGFLFLFLPVVIAVLLASVLGLLVGLLLLVIYFGLLLVAAPLTIVLLASYIARSMKQKNISLITILAGAGIVSGLLLIPFVGVLLFLALYIVTLGTVVLVVFQKTLRS